MHVYVLQHTIERDGEEDSKLIGVYSSKNSADAAIARLRDKPGFRLKNGSFSVDAYKMDEDNWTEGFGVE